MNDVIIIGAGPAGLSAALTLGRMHRETVLLDAGSGRNAPAAAVHNLLLGEGLAPAELRRRAREQLAPYPSVRVVDAEVSEVAPGARFAVTLATGERVTARRLLLATGVRDELPPVEGLAERWGRSVFHCPYCHGFEVTGRRVVVLGGGPARARLAVQLRRSFADDVVLCAGGPPGLDDATAAVVAAHGIAVREEPVLRLDDDAVVLAAGDDDGDSIAADAVFVPTTVRQRAPFAADLGCALLPDGAVEVDEFGRTSVPGVYAAGDLAHRATLPMPVSAVVAAMAAGTVAAAMLDQDLLAADTGLPDLLAAAR
ncbi:NAD(P)/FAD-dependent oxidoreductase [Jiangella rhizosphaerae]|uniref:NAD(P)/FAD-dependent oxidoreductase n=1 Tax=Jiangella rhizosphaerae TaxID=2293569 RepID=A0A418KH99_9ACTN|nr:NAD(P)/FAD-dependent oxidoreductase [Jiangella rhizosphaerae]RIQ11592.1 NAD(P)/FAD-dependent oxidoreductase [Jiangella rhizosphaerae]